MKQKIEKDEKEGNASKVTCGEKDSEGDEVEKKDMEKVSKIETRSMTDAKGK